MLPLRREGSIVDESALVAGTPAPHDPWNAEPSTEPRPASRVLPPAPLTSLVLALPRELARRDIRVARISLPGTLCFALRAPGDRTSGFDGDASGRIDGGLLDPHAPQPRLALEAGIEHGGRDL